MKIALCYSGQINRFADAHANHQLALMAFNDVDVFAYTSNAVTQKKGVASNVNLPPLNGVVKEYLPGGIGWMKMFNTYGIIYNVDDRIITDRINDICGDRLKKLYIEDEDIDEDNNEVEKITKWQWLKKRQLHKMSRSNQLARQYAKDGGFEYDLIIRSRYDYTLNIGIDFEELVARTIRQYGSIDNKIFLFGGWLPPAENRFMDRYLFDGFAFGCPSVMDIYCSLNEKEDAYPPMEKYDHGPESKKYAVEYQLHTHLQENNIEIVYLNDPDKQLDDPQCGRWLYSVIR